MLDFTSLFCAIDDFCQVFELEWKKQQLPKSNNRRYRETNLCLSEMMYIVVRFHHSYFRNFKAYYVFLQTYYQGDFRGGLPSYHRFIELMPRTFLPLSVYLNYRRGTCTGIQFIDSTAIAVCKNKRIKRNRVFAHVAKVGKSSMGWFFGFKLHLIINEFGDLLAFKVTTGNINDRSPVEELTKNLSGKLYGDKGYISQSLFERVLQNGVQLITSLKKKMKNKLLPMLDKLLLKKRSLIETVNDQLKNICNIEHSRHRSINNFAVNLIAGLVAYTHLDKKPSIHWDRTVLCNQMPSLSGIIL